MRRLPIVLLASCFLCSAAAAQELTGTLKRIADTGEFKIGFVPDAPPMSFINEEGNPAGYTIALCRTVTAAVKKATGLEEMKVTYVPLILPEDRLSAVENGSVDIAELVQGCMRRRSFDHCNGLLFQVTDRWNR